jgi:hypothetical protein
MQHFMGKIHLCPYVHQALSWINKAEHRNFPETLGEVFTLKFKSSRLWDTWVNMAKNWNFPTIVGGSLPY